MTIDQLRELVFKYMGVIFDYDALKLRVYETPIYGHKEEMQTTSIVYKRAAFTKKYAEAVVRVPTSMNITGSNATLSTDQKKSLYESGVLSVGPGSSSACTTNNKSFSATPPQNTNSAAGFYATPNPNSMTSYDARGKSASPVNGGTTNIASPDLSNVNVVNVVNLWYEYYTYTMRRNYAVEDD